MTSSIKKNQTENYEIKVDSRESIRLPQKLRKKIGIQSGSILILHLDKDGKFYFEKKDTIAEKKKKATQKKDFLNHFEKMDVSEKEDVSSETFLKKSRRY
jgi:bifunctional DNA-binding transcriptional regulator/antitoxin component of YhaV-PrlF toxin-antitoxin module